MIDIACNGEEQKRSEEVNEVIRAFNQRFPISNGPYTSSDLFSNIRIEYEGLEYEKHVEHLYFSKAGPSYFPPCVGKKWWKLEMTRVRWEEHIIKSSR